MERWGHALGWGKILMAVRTTGALYECFYFLFQKKREMATDLYVKQAFIVCGRTLSLKGRLRISGIMGIMEGSLDFIPSVMGGHWSQGVV